MFVYAHNKLKKKKLHIFSFRLFYMTPFHSVSLSATLFAVFSEYIFRYFVCYTFHQNHETWSIIPLYNCSSNDRTNKAKLDTQKSFDGFLLDDGNILRVSM